MLQETTQIQGVDYTEVIKAVLILAGGIITAFVAIATAVIAVFGGAVSEAWKERRASKKAKTSIHQTVFADKLLLFAEIHARGVALVNNPKNRIDRFLILRTINGDEAPKVVQAPFGYSVDKKVDMPNRYTRVDVSGDSQYQKMLKLIQTGQNYRTKTSEMENGLLKTLYLHESESFQVVEFEVFKIGNRRISEERLELWYISVGTYHEEGFEDWDVTQIELFRSFAIAKIAD